MKKMGKLVPTVDSTSERTACFFAGDRRGRRGNPAYPALARETKQIDGPRQRRDNVKVRVAPQEVAV